MEVQALGVRGAQTPSGSRKGIKGALGVSRGRQECAGSGLVPPITGQTVAQAQVRQRETGGGWGREMGAGEDGQGSCRDGQEPRPH